MTENASGTRRPLIAIPARFSPGATALRYEAEVTARALVEAVFAAGGEPLVIHPHAPDLQIDVKAAGDRIWFAEGVLLPGGGDVAARWSGQQPHPTQYGVDEEQDAFDLAVARVALNDHLPLLAIWRSVVILFKTWTIRSATTATAFMILRWTRPLRWVKSLDVVRPSPATTTNALQLWEPA
jgi:gamma-glutamyl-gamma-aminobutyrate hydrolase PuuD